VTRIPGRRPSGPAGSTPQGGPVPAAQPHAAGGISAARPPLIRALNAQLLLDHIRRLGRCSPAELARLSGLSKPTVSLALAEAERCGLVRPAGQRTGVPGRPARLYEIRPEAGFVLGLDVGLKYLRGALTDLSGGIRAKSSVKVTAAGAGGRVAELIGLADALCEQAGITRRAVTQTVIGCPGVYDPHRDSMALPGGITGWGRPGVLAGLRQAFGPGLVIENDVNAATLAERTHGHGRGVRDFAFVWIGTGIGLGLVIDGRLHRGRHGVAGEIAYMPLAGDGGADGRDARRRGILEAAASASGVVRAARRADMRGPLSARRVFAAAAAGDRRAAAVVRAEARLIAKAVCSAVTVVDPELIVLGGGIGQAPGFAAAVSDELAQMAPVMPEVQVSALGTDAVVDGCIAAGTEFAWRLLTAAVSRPPHDGGLPPAASGTAGS